MYNTNSNDELVIKLIGKITLEFNEFEDFSKQLKLKEIIEKSLYEYDVVTKEKALMVSDIEEKMQMFLACRKLDGISNRTLKNYNYTLLEFSRFMAKPVSTITTNDIRVYLIQTCEKVKDSTRSTKIFILKSFFRWLSDEEYIDKNPMNKIKSPKVGKRLRKSLTEENLERLRLGCKTDRESALIELLFSSAIRVSELSSLNTNQINWNDRSFILIGKGNKEDKVYFSYKAKILLEKYLETRTDKNEALFVGDRLPHNRLGVRAIQSIVNKIKIKAGLENVKVTPHILRHTKATHSLNKGVKLEIVQKFLRHSNPSTTLIYASLDDTYVKSEYNRVM